ncbi:MAG: hypothetical protein V4672_20270 [Verrucomicrobiota bacterium]
MPAKTENKQLHFSAALACSFGLVTGAFVVEQAIRYTDHLEGLVSGLLHVFFTGIGWAVYFLPWSLLVYAVYYWGKWNRFRTAWIIAPALLWFFGQLSSLITSPPTPQHRLKQYAGASLPLVTEGLRYYFRGGGVADYSDTYYFKCSKDDVDRLILEMQLERDPSFGQLEAWGPIAALRDAPDPKTWKSATMYRRNDGGWFYYLLVNAGSTEVYIHYGCI